MTVTHFVLSLLLREHGTYQETGTAALQGQAAVQNPRTYSFMILCSILQSFSLLQDFLLPSRTVAWCFKIKPRLYRHDAKLQRKEHGRWCGILMQGRAFLALNHQS